MRGAPRIQGQAFPPWVGVPRLPSAAPGEHALANDRAHRPHRAGQPIDTNQHRQITQVHQVGCRRLH
jgi:hypothetical protein